MTFTVMKIVQQGWLRDQRRVRVSTLLQIHFDRQTNKQTTALPFQSFFLFDPFKKPKGITSSTINLLKNEAIMELIWLLRSRLFNKIPNNNIFNNFFHPKTFLPSNTKKTKTQSIKQLLCVRSEKCFFFVSD